MEDPFGQITFGRPFQEFTAYQCKQPTRSLQCLSISRSGWPRVCRHARESANLFLSERARRSVQHGFPDGISTLSQAIYFPALDESEVTPVRGVKNANESQWALISSEEREKVSVGFNHGLRFGRASDFPTAHVCL